MDIEAIELHGQGLDPELADIQRLVNAGHTRPQIVSRMIEIGHSISRTTLSRRLSHLGLSTAAPRLTPLQRAAATPLIRQCHRMSYGLDDTVSEISHAYRIPITRKVLITISQRLGLNWRRDDLQTGAITRGELRDMIHHQIEERDRDAGVRTMKHALGLRQVRVHRDTVAEIMRELDPEGVALRGSGALKRRVFRCPGPNFVWSADGHDKLKPYGITIYGFIDAWSRRVLHFDVGISNNDPRMIAYQYLLTVKKAGGFPVQTCTDHGTETIGMAGLQIHFSRKYLGLEPADAIRAHIFTTSTKNLKIESLWRLLRRRNGLRIHDCIQEAIDDQRYDPYDPLEKLVFIDIAVPLVRSIVNEYQVEKNTKKTRYNRNSALPTSCRPNVSYYNPARFGGEQGLTPISSAEVDEIIQRQFPDLEMMLCISPPRLANHIQEASQRLNIETERIDLINMWTCHAAIVNELRDSYPELYEVVDVDALWEE